MKIQGFKTAATLACATLTTLLCSSLAFADDSDEMRRSPTAIKSGCYDVIRGHMAESSVDAKSVVGEYRFVLTPEHLVRGPTFVLTGPLSGTESVEESAKAAAKASQVKAAEPEGPHGGHNLGTYKRVGTFSSVGDSIVVTSASCPNGEGIPQFIKGIETLKFVKGTGIFTNLTSGQIDFNLTFDSCNNKNNPIANLEVIRGKMCFR